MVSDWRGKRTCILGCGNVLFGDDGFGPAVAQYCIRHCTIPADVCVHDVGTSVRNILFDILLSEEKPSYVVIIDAMDVGCEPGELFTPDLDALPSTKTDDFSMHQIPTSNLLRELRDLCEVAITILACQVAHIPKGVSPGLSGPVSEAVPRAVELLAREHCIRQSPHVVDMLAGDEPPGIR